MVQEKNEKKKSFDQLTFIYEHKKGNATSVDTTFLNNNNFFFEIAFIW